MLVNNSRYNDYYSDPKFTSQVVIHIVAEESRLHTTAPTVNIRCSFCGPNTSNAQNPVLHGSLVGLEDKRSELTLRPFDLCGDDCASSGGFDSSFPPEDGSGNESNDEADGQRLHKGVGHVDEGILVELLGVLNGSDLRGGRGGV
jgi:hypothetical protein